MDSFKRFNEDKLPNKKYFCRSLKNGRTGDDGKKLHSQISLEDFLTCEKFGMYLTCKIWGIIMIIT